MKGLSAALLLALTSAATPALASGSIDCVSEGGQASVGLTIGSLPVLAVVGAAIEVDGESWNLNGEGATAIRVGQAFGTDEEMRVDFTDPNVERVVAQLRLFSASEGNAMATAGILRIPGTGAWAVSCTGP